MVTAEGEAPEITAEMVLQIVPIRRDKAERIAAYVTARYAGQRPSDACNEAGVQQGSKTGYEKYVQLLRDRFGLPSPPVRDSQPFNRDPSDYGRLGAHLQHHVRTGVRSSSCVHCRKGALGS
ncbi:hypothetical protein [Actinomadura sp. 21ATH]|uniref:hypothetical protein n=1 Tax=Actinomadura sp. 21ATH TaxID=1735444 RepID=UPI0035BF14AF